MSTADVSQSEREELMAVGQELEQASGGPGEGPAAGTGGPPGRGMVGRLMNDTPHPDLDELSGLPIEEKYAPKYIERAILKLTEGGEGTPAVLDLLMGASLYCYIALKGELGGGGGEGGRGQGQEGTGQRVEPV